MKQLTNTQFIEGRVLPVVIAFGLGVLVTSHAARAELDRWANTYGEVLTEVRALRVACGLEPDHDQIARHTLAQFSTSQQEPTP